MGFGLEVRVDPNCTWRMRATKLLSSVSLWNANHRQATAKVLGTLICSNYGEKKYGLNPKQIMEQVRLDHGVHIRYKQAWKRVCSGFDQRTHKDSYKNLSKWLFKVNEKNPGSKVYLEMDPKGKKFKYSFFAFGQSIRGFELMRRVIAVGGTFLKGNFKGTLLGGSAQDGDYLLYPLAFGIIDSENEHVWTWFFSGLVIPEASDLVFVSDRVHAIAKVFLVVYPLAHHGICRIHLLRNITPKYGRTGLLPLVEAAADTYTCYEFIGIFNDIRSRSPKLAAYLEESDFVKWARSYALSNRYNIMTTNIAESLNSIIKLAHDLPIMSLYETIRLTLITWFHEHREKALKHKKLVTPQVLKTMLERYNAAMKHDVFQVDPYEFEIKDETRKIPCVHAIAAAKRTNKDENNHGKRYGIHPPPIEAAAYEIKASLVRLIQETKFLGSGMENPYDHLDCFERLCDTFRTGGVPQDSIKLILFPFSLG
ncbi:uncharacterized protein LOC112082145 [Eutrema salsugineum]|uniref:uncharacterized protein LOC112082145 n=1 Tax=Eutrema salsugineum TaxID=72664 RepID=UPI000CED4AAC|nr:uncharacterized protein LOC112082145 [Eutrema salsugineum]